MRSQKILLAIFSAGSLLLLNALFEYGRTPTLEAPKKTISVEQLLQRRKIFDASLLYSYSKNEFLVGQICYLSFKSLAIVLCVFISCFSIQFFCLEKKENRVGMDCHTFVENKDYSFTTPNANLVFSIFIVKRTVLANSARLSQWEAKCVHDYSKISEALELRSTFLGKHIYVFIPFRICNGLRQFHLG